MRKLLTSLTVIGAVAALSFGLSQAFFSDTETSTDNVFQAGKLDLLIDNESYYNSQPSPETSWDLDNLTDHLFFNFNDLKPGDLGEDTISIHVDNNDAWACMQVTVTEDNDATCTEPELLDDIAGCDEPNDDTNDGELGSNLKFIFWADDGDNVLEQDEVNKIFKKYPENPNPFGSVWPLADALTNIWGNAPGTPLTGGQTYFIGKAWCFGNNLQLAPLAQDNLGPTSPQSPANTTGGVICDGSQLDNRTQTDTFKLDVSFSAYQHRNNSNFTCNGQVPSVSVSPTAPITSTPTPTLAQCQQADVMLVLDRSGSISTSELTDLKIAANSFVTDLSLSTLGIHAGMTSFATTGTLNVHLTDDEVALTTAINGLTSGGFTNLNEGLSLAQTEHANPGDGHDRADIASPDKVIVVTDGHPNRPLPSDTADDLAAATATAYKAGGAEVWVLGIGSDVNTPYLTSLASSAGHYYSVADYSGLNTALQDLDLCE